MKALIQILFSSSIQQLPKADEDRTGTQVRLKPIGAPHADYAFSNVLDARRLSRLRGAGL